MIEEGFREYVKEAQETIGIPPPQEYMEKRYKHDSGLRHEFNEGVIYTLKFERDFFVTLVYYAAQEGLTIDLLVKKILEDEIARDQEEIGYFSTKEIQERYERGRQKVLKENELVQRGKMTTNEKDEFREKNK